MKIHDFEQYTPEWYAVRLGIPTASGFDSIFTATGKESTTAETYMYKLLAEWLTGKAEEGYTNAHMERGKELEAEARSYYEFTTDATVRQVGFISTDDGLCGCSPDGLSDEGGLEIKCPSPGVHVQYMLAQACPSKYIPQIQGSMMVTGLPWWDFISYHPDMQPVLVRVKRDEEYISAMRQAMGKFITKMLTRREQLNQLRAAA